MRAARALTIRSLEVVESGVGGNASFVTEFFNESLPRVSAAQHHGFATLTWLNEPHCDSKSTGSGSICVFLGPRHHRSPGQCRERFRYSVGGVIHNASLSRHAGVESRLMNYWRAQWRCGSL